MTFKKYEPHCIFTIFFIFFCNKANINIRCEATQSLLTINILAYLAIFTSELLLTCSCSTGPIVGNGGDGTEFDAWKSGEDVDESTVVGCSNSTEEFDGKLGT